MTHPNSKEYTRRYYLKIRGTGRCTHCVNPAEKGKLRCAYHNAYQKEYFAKRRAERKAQGLCVICKVPAKETFENRTFCESHLIQIRMRAKMYREEHKLQNLCIKCWQPATGLYCSRHKEKAKIYGRKACKVYYNKHKLMGLCVYCPNKAQKNRTMCRRHLHKRRKAA